MANDAHHGVLNDGSRHAMFLICGWWQSVFWFFGV